MTNAEIIALAQKAGFETKRGMVWVDQWEVSRSLERFAALVAAAERERDTALLRQALEAIRAAKNNYGIMLLSDPPQQAWKAYGVDHHLCAAEAALSERLGVKK